MVFMPDGAVLAVLDVYYATMGSGAGHRPDHDRRDAVPAQAHDRPGQRAAPPELAGITLGRVMIPRNRSNKILYSGPATAATAASLASCCVGKVIRNVRASRRQSLWLSSPRMVVANPF